MLQKIPTSEIIIGSIGLIIGLIIANLISGPLKLLQISWLTSIISALLYVALGYLGISIATKKKDDLANIFSFEENQY